MNAQAATPSAPASTGALLRDWRQRRRLSQLELAADAAISTRHLSFVETGRARASRELLLHLAQLLDLPLRERNVLLVSAGFAPMYAKRALDAPELAAARSAIELVLRGHEPYPALALDRHWNLVLANRAAQRLFAQVAPALLAPPVNMMRLSLHPDGLGGALLNAEEVRARMLHRLRRQVANSGDAALAALLRELSVLPGAPGATTPVPDPYAGVVLPLRLRTPAGEVALFSTLTVFGTPVEVTLSELALEAFFPADEASAQVLRRLAE
ncbi:MAG: helix-turn-helix transcriptional regulator [Chiayiivirga sp.]|jgi:transcriptional regulator with XRE-family HTH domain|uniref:helix-turn-helix domain-containing protein n=1 Tax=Chiayiivirga sp. TaxID=2041042 RepID=UPI0025BAF16B|nr:helix-turn-helix transcriptional regulator [Chiayiivirga sp.]MCI1710981.1 helix-turn-helix transcriptional regulator [Chiayiivirga sp.]MCI1728205.1 helix-turn-helix transcriptional regulator [Chiayiivirga sp.]